MVALLTFLRARLDEVCMCRGNRIRRIPTIQFARKYYTQAPGGWLERLRIAISVLLPVAFSFRLLSARSLEFDPLRLQLSWL